MLTHPGTAIIPAALVAAEAEGASGRDFITGVAAGYEVMERMAADWIPTVMARGFHAGPVFSIFGAADRGRQDHALHRRPGTRHDLSLHEPGGKQPRKPRAARGRRRAKCAAGGLRWRSRERSAAAKRCSKVRRGSTTPTPANNAGRLTYSFVGATETRLDTLTAKLGDEWMLLETLYRIYSIAGYNIAHVDVTAKLCEEHNIKYGDVDRIEAVVNWLETQYPSPAFPRSAKTSASRRRGGTSTTRRTVPSNAGSRCWP